MKKNLVLFFVFLLFGSFNSEKPKILIIGDSISIGYTPFVQEALKNEAIVKHNPGNAQHTGTGLLKVEEWIGNKDWDIIQFNWGLWDLCYRHPEASVYGNRDKINGTITFSSEQYKENLIKLVIRLKQTDAKLIFVTTSYVPEGEAGRFKGDEIKYNKVAKKIMKENNVLVNDIHKASKKIHKKYMKEEGDVHFTEMGYELLAIEIINFIREEIN
jgi:lysophospholipase L1-like esterase